MIPIFLDGKGQGYRFEEFERQFAKICRSHHKEGRALAFAFILYDFDHPEIIKVLRDSDYWNALDKISGRYLSVFSFHHRQQKRRGRNRVGKEQPYSFGDSQRFINEAFGTAVPDETPLILFFQVTGETISNPCIIRVEAETVEQAFIEIRSVLKDAVGSIKKVKEEFRRNTTEVFNLITTRLFQRKTVLLIKKAVPLVGSVKDFFAKLK